MATDVSEYVFIRAFDEAHEYLLSNSLPSILCVLGVYLLFVLKLGPYIMKDREPFKLKNTLLVYNAIQVILSALLVYYTGLSIFIAGPFPKRCCEEDPAIRRVMLRGASFYLACKLIELLDTVFFILRKKYNQVSFLHVYHHTSVVLGAWTMFNYAPSQTLAFTAFINSLVHVVMYFYYFMAALGPEYQKYITWKSHITTFQLVQFVSVIIYLFLSLALTSCKHSIAGIVYVLASSLIFFFLFLNFYKKSYSTPKKTTKNGVQNGTEAKTKAL